MDDDPASRDPPLRDPADRDPPWGDAADGDPPSAFGFATDLERAGHQVVTLIDSVLWDQDASFAGTRALLAVSRAPETLIHAGEIGRAMGVTRQAAGLLLRRQAAAGHVEVVDEGWARSVRITAAGRDHLQACLEEIEMALGGLGCVDPARLEGVASFLRALAALLEGRSVAWPPEG